MKKIITLSILCIILAVSVYGQKKTYVTSGAEIIFSQATMTDSENPDANSTLRFAPIISVQSMLNVDKSDKLGFFTGLGYRNVGYIYDDYTTRDPLAIDPMPIKKKFRTYNIGIPVGVKIGDMNKLFFYGGYEIEFPFVYKEKTFNTAGEKTNTDVYWFGNRAETVQQSWFVGVQLPYGMNVKFKYYFTEFHNQNFEANGIKPYEGLNSKIWYISLCANLFKNAKFITSN